MSLTHINNGDTGLSARTKINASFDAVDALGAPGSSGTSGSSGSSGINGTSGESGSSGINGTSGVNGVSGTSGTSGGGSGPLTSSIQTTNGATTSIVNLTMGTYSAFSIEATISAYDSDNYFVYGSQLFAVFGNAGSVTQVSTTDVYEKSDFTTATSDILLADDFGDIDIVVIGETDKNIDWVVNYSVTKI